MVLVEPIDPTLNEVDDKGEAMTELRVNKVKQSLAESKVVTVPMLSLIHI